MLMTKTHQSLVAINAQLLSGGASYRSAGISTYLSNLLAHLKPDSTLSYRVFTGQEALSGTITLPVTLTKFATDHPLQRIAWEQCILPLRLKRLKADILHAPAFVGPLISACPQIVTVHDLSFLRFPHFFRRNNRVYLTLMTGISCRRAAAVIAVSKFTASEVNRLLHVPEDRIVTVYHGVDPRFQPLPRQMVEDFRERMDLPKRFILFLGTLEPRKNLVQLIRAYAQLKDKSIHLILAGAQGWLYKELYEIVESLAMQNYVHFTGYVRGEDQVLWYNAADVFAYLSKYEGFGLPVLEALACGIPTLTAANSSLPEAAGDGALQVAGDELSEVVEKLHQLLTDEALRESLRQKGLAHAGQFTWEATAENTRRVYAQVLNRR